jgi:trigger factor
MEIIELRTEEVLKEFKVSISQKTLAKEFFRSLLTLQKQTKIDGFRPGKVPMDLLRQRFKDQIQSSGIEHFVHEALEKLTAPFLDQGLMGEPRVYDLQFDQSEEASAVTFCVSFMVMPQFPELNYKDISVRQFDIEPASGEIDKVLRYLSFVYGSNAEPQEGDCCGWYDEIKVKLDAQLDGEACFSDEEISLVLNNEKSAFQALWIGKSISDEVLLPSTFPKELAQSQSDSQKIGRPFSGTGYITQLTKRIPVESEVELAEKAGAQSVEELHSNTLSVWKEQFKNFALQISKKDLLDQIDAQTTSFVLPDHLVKAEWRSIALAQKEGESDSLDHDHDHDHDHEHEHAHDGHVAEQEPSQEDRQSPQWQTAQRRVRLGLYLVSLGRKHKIRTEEEDIHAVILERFPFIRLSQGLIDKIKADSALYQQIESAAFEQKIVQWLFGQVNQTVITIGQEAFLKLYSDVLGD